MCNENQIVLGVVTESHVPERMKSIPAAALQSFYQNDVTTILHAGDICNSRTLTQLEKVAPVIAVRGNRDIWSSSGRSLPLSLVVEFGGVKIGLTHGHGGLWQYFYEKVLYYTVGFSYSRYFHRLHKEFASNVSVIVFGHTHRMVNKWVDDRLLFNPGSLGPEYYDGNGPSVGILRIIDGSISAEVLPVDY